MIFRPVLIVPSVCDVGLRPVLAGQERDVAVIRVGSRRRRVTGLDAPAIPAERLGRRTSSQQALRWLASDGGRVMTGPPAFGGHGAGMSVSPASPVPGRWRAGLPVRPRATRRLTRPETLTLWRLPGCPDSAEPYGAMVCARAWM